MYSIYMKVQKGQLDNGKNIWLVLDDNYLPVEPISKYLRYLDSDETFSSHYYWICEEFETLSKHKV